MSLLNFIRLPARAWITFSAIAAAITLGVHGEAENVPPQATQIVREFEQRMWRQMGGENRQNSRLPESEAVKREVRTFFAGLDSSEVRLEAIGLIDSRFFGAHIVSGDLAPELLRPLIRDADLSVRVRAARAIGVVGCGAQYAKELIALLDGELSAEALEDVAYALGRSQHQPFARHLEKLLGHADAEVRPMASFELIRLAPTAGIRHNLGLLDDEETLVRLLAIENFSREFRKGRIVTSLMRMFMDEDPEVSEQAGLVADALRKRLSDEHYEVRGKAALALAEMQQHASHVAPLLEDREVTVRRSAAQAMGLMADPRYIDKLRPLMDDENPHVRKAAAKSIAQLEAVKTVGEQDGADQPATVPKSSPGGEVNPKPVSEGRSQ